MVQQDRTCSTMVGISTEQNKNKMVSRCHEEIMEQRTKENHKNHFMASIIMKSQIISTFALFPLFAVAQKHLIRSYEFVDIEKTRNLNMNKNTISTFSSPKVIVPSDTSPVEEHEIGNWTSVNRLTFLDLALDHGSVLLRGFPINSPDR